MGLGLGQALLVAAFLLVTSLAFGQGDGDAGGEAAATPDGASVDAAQPSAEAQNPCDGTICETQTGTTCGVTGIALGHRPTALSGSTIVLVLLASGALMRRGWRGPRRGASCPCKGTDVGPLAP
jgi:hypothetical protein